MLDDQVVFIVDLNELENGDELPVSMDYTVNAGPGVLNSLVPQPHVGDWVYVHSDDDNTLFRAVVASVESLRDMTVRIIWDSRTQILNKEWSAQEIADWTATQEAETASGKLA
jgi:hypothetical protein